MNYQHSGTLQEASAIEVVVDWITIIRRRVFIIPSAVALLLAATFIAQSLWMPSYEVEVAVFRNPASETNLTSLISRTNLVNVDLTLQNNMERSAKALDELPSTDNILSALRGGASRNNHTTQQIILTKLIKSLDFKINALETFSAEKKLAQEFVDECMVDSTRCAKRFKIDMPRGQDELIFISYSGTYELEAETAMDALNAKIQSTAISFASSLLSDQIKEEKNKAQLRLDNIRQFKELAKFKSLNGIGINGEQGSDVQQLVIAAIESEIKLLSSIDVAEWVGEPLKFNVISSSRQESILNSVIVYPAAVILGIALGILTCFAFHWTAVIRRAFGRPNPTLDKAKK